MGIEDRRLTGIIPIRAAPWVSFVPHLVAGVLAGVGEEVVEVEEVSEVILLFSGTRPWLLGSPIGRARMRRF